MILTNFVFCSYAKFKRLKRRATSFFPSLALNVGRNHPAAVKQPRNIDTSPIQSRFPLPFAVLCSEFVYQHRNQRFYRPFSIHPGNRAGVRFIWENFQPVAEILVTAGWDAFSYKHIEAFTKEIALSQHGLPMSYEEAPRNIFIEKNPRYNISSDRPFFFYFSSPA